MLTRLFFLLSVGDTKGGEPWTKGKIVDVQELVKDEVWTVTVRLSSSATESFYILEPTCEVLGHPPSPAHPSPESPQPSFDSTLPLRSDWSAYIAYRLLPVSAHTSPPRTLMEHLEWQNREEYDKGISKLWLRRIESEGELGIAKRVVAERYVLACVVGNRYRAFILMT